MKLDTNRDKKKMGYSTMQVSFILVQVKYIYVNIKSSRTRTLRESPPESLDDELRDAVGSPCTILEEWLPTGNTFESGDTDVVGKHEAL